MKSFEELKKEIPIARFIGSELGTTYIDTNLPRSEMIVIRHLDSKLTIELLSTYEELYNEIIKWIEDNSKIQQYVFMPSLIEIGKDYFIRPFYVYDIAIRDYMDKEDEDYIEPPELFKEMQNEVSNELKEESGKEGLIQRILRKSLLEPTGKTIYDHIINKFIIVEPKVSLEDIKEWQNQLS